MANFLNNVFNAWQARKTFEPIQSPFRNDSFEKLQRIYIFNQIKRSMICSVFFFPSIHSTSIFVHSSTIPSRIDWPLRFNRIKKKNYFFIFFFSHFDGLYLLATLISETRALIETAFRPQNTYCCWIELIRRTADWICLTTHTNAHSGVGCRARVPFASLKSY